MPDSSAAARERTSHIVSEDTGKAAHGRGKWHFVRHYLEMVVAMLVGMFVLGATVRGVLALSGVDDYSMNRYPELMTLEMAFDMSVAMALWMRFRRHDWAPTLEMCGVMFVPAIVLFPLLWTEVITAGSLMTLEHVGMFVLMLLAMLRRRGEYGL